MEIRTAKISDLENVVELLYSSGCDLYDYLFNTSNHTAIEFIKYEFLSGKGICGFNNVIVICNDNEVIGTACYYDKKGYTTTSNETLFNVFKYYKFADIVLIVFRFLKVLKLMKKPSNGEIYLSNFAITKMKQGNGFGSEFIRKCMVKYKDQGFSIIGLDVEEENNRAMKLYERLGFIKKEEKSVTIKNTENGRFVGIKMELQI
jgi:ribosomal protein S18 acetylase RimI-like enzyme